MNMFTFLIDRFKRWWMNKSSPRYLRGLSVSDAALSRRDEKITRLNERGASKRRVGLYLARWLGWASITFCATATASLCTTPQIVQAGRSCVCNSGNVGVQKTIGADTFSWVSSGGGFVLKKCANGTTTTCNISIASGDSIPAGTLFLKNADPADPAPYFSCFYTLGSGFTSPQSYNPNPPPLWLPPPRRSIGYLSRPKQRSFHYSQWRG